METPDLLIENVTDWRRLPERGLDTIVDPMIFRTADVYLRGRKGSEESLPGKDPEDVWTAIGANLDSLAAFFDALILAEQLPIIDYGITFNSNVGYNPWSLYEKINTYAKKPLLVSTHVMGNASSTVRNSAIETLRERKPAPPDLTASVLKEMSAFDYAWRPDLSSLGNMTDDDELLARFLYGGLLFSGFAQSAGVAHLLQPKRACLQVAMALQAPSISVDHEEELFDELKRVASKIPDGSTDLFEMNRLPHFLPYLLWGNPSNPDDLLMKALGLRKTRLAKEYRKWRAELLEDWRSKGRYDPAIIARLDGVARDLQRKYQPGGDLTMDVGASFGVTGFGVDASLPVPIGRIWGWIQKQLPGRRYTKLLMRLRLAEQTYIHIDRHLSYIWNKA